MPSPGLVARWARPGDLARVVSMLVRADDPAAPHPVTAAEAFGLAFREPAPFRFVLAERGLAVLAAASVHEARSATSGRLVVEVRDLVVVPGADADAAREALLALAERHAATAGAEALRVVLDARDAASTAALGRRGFEESGSRTLAKALPAPGPDGRDDDGLRDVFGG